MTARTTWTPQPTKVFGTSSVGEDLESFAKTLMTKSSSLLTVLEKTISLPCTNNNTKLIADYYLGFCSELDFLTTTSPSLLALLDKYLDVIQTVSKSQLSDIEKIKQQESLIRREGSVSVCTRALETAFQQGYSWEGTQNAAERDLANKIGKFNYVLYSIKLNLGFIKNELRTFPEAQPIIDTLMQINQTCMDYIGYLNKLKNILYDQIIPLMTTNQDANYSTPQLREPTKSSFRCNLI